jgi:Molecular chaperone (small heat shock protein)
MLPSKKSQNWLPGIFNDFLGSDWIEKVNYTSPINIIETESDYKIEIAAPGLTKDDFTVKVNNDNVMHVCVKHKEQNEEKDKKGHYLRREFSYSQFQQNLILPDNVDKDKICAAVKHGILHIDIPKKTPDKAEVLEKIITIN